MYLKLQFTYGNPKFGQMFVYIWTVNMLNVFSLLLNFVEVSLAKHFCSNQQIFKLSTQSEKKNVYFSHPAVGTVHISLTLFQ